MSTERDPFGLTNLAQPQQEANGWPAIEQALHRRKATRRYRWLASAAAVTLAIGIYWQLPHPETDQEATDPSVAVLEASGKEHQIEQQKGDTHSDRDSASLASLVNLSQQLERNLQLIRNEVSVMPEQAVIYQVEIQDLVAQLDEAINQNPESRELWSQRVNLLLDLNQLYRVQLRRDYSHVASL